MNIVNVTDKNKVAEVPLAPNIIWKTKLAEALLARTLEKHPSTIMNVTG